MVAEGITEQQRSFLPGTDEMMWKNVTRVSEILRKVP